MTKWIWSYYAKRDYCNGGNRAWELLDHSSCFLCFILCNDNPSLLRHIVWVGVYIHTTFGCLDDKRRTVGLLFNINIKLPQSQIVGFLLKRIYVNKMNGETTKEHIIWQEYFLCYLLLPLSSFLLLSHSLFLSTLQCVARSVSLFIVCHILYLRIIVSQAFFFVYIALYSEHVAFR